MHYSIFVPKQAVGANLVYFDFFVPSDSPFNPKLLVCQPMVSGDVAVTGVVGADLLLTRTSAIGTGGTTMTAEGTSITAMTISARNGSQPMPLSQVSGRLTPTGGATAGGIISWASVSTEETNSGSYIVPLDLARLGYGEFPGIEIRKGTGFRVIQGAVASVGNIGFNIVISDGN